ncbi:MAG: bifunctional DNA primase/polymerase [Parvibaculales bacterium]
MTKPKPSIYGQWAEQLYQNGFQPLALNGKRPISGWREFALPSDETERINYINRQRTKNIGLRTGKLVAIDVDEENPEKIAVINEARLNFLGATDFIRIGKKPRAVYLYRTNAPLKKMQVGGVEVLGEGQQVVIAGIHPETKEPYTWPHVSILDSTLDDLPFVSSGDIRGFVAELGGGEFSNSEEREQTGEILAVEGYRNQTLFKELLQVALKCSTSQELSKKASMLNTKLQPMLDDEEVQDTVKSVWKRKISRQIAPEGGQFIRLTMTRTEFDKLKYNPLAYLLISYIKFHIPNERFYLQQKPTAAKLNVSINTIRGAIKFLIDEGFMKRDGEGVTPGSNHLSIIYKLLI